MRWQGGFVSKMNKRDSLVTDVRKFFAALDTGEELLRGFCMSPLSVEFRKTPESSILNVSCPSRPIPLTIWFDEGEESFTELLHWSGVEWLDRPCALDYSA